MSISLKSPIEQIEELLKTSPRSTDIVFSCTSGGRGLHIQAWDLSNRAVLRTYRSDMDGEGSCLCMAGQDYLLCGLKNKPFIYVWKIEKEQVYLRIACTGLITAMICDPSGTYCIASINEKINIWEVCTGYLLGQLSRHYQSVSALHFVNEGSGYFISGGRDCLAITWNLGSVLSEQRLSHSKEDPHAPKQLTHDNKSFIFHTWADHSLTVTSITSNGRGNNKKIATASLDQSCKLYDFTTGTLLCTFLFDIPLSCVLLSASGLWLYVGSISGSITAAPLFLPVKLIFQIFLIFLQSQKQINEVSTQNKFAVDMNEHTKPITSLSISSFGGHLVSSSEDCVCHIWDINSHQKLRTIQHKGPVVSTILCPDLWRLTHSTTTTYISTISLKPFEKSLHYKSGDIMEHTVPLLTRPVHMLQSNVIQEIDRLSGEEIKREFSFQPQWMLTTDDSTADLEAEVSCLKQELREMKEVHRRLYSFTMEQLLTQNSHQ